MPPKKRQRQESAAQTTLARPAASAPRRARARRLVERDVLPETAPSALARRDDEPLSCGACLLAVEADAQVGLVDNCLHVFHFECVERWSRTENSCPQCKTRFFWLAAYSPIAEHKPARTSPKVRRTSLNRIMKRDQEGDEEGAFEEVQACERCGEVGDEEKLLLCDGMHGTCNAAYHFTCVGLTGVPQSSWFCPDCVDRGFDTDAKGRQGSRQASSSSSTTSPPASAGAEAAIEHATPAVLASAAAAAPAAALLQRSHLPQASAAATAPSAACGQPRSRGRGIRGGPLPSQLRLSALACVSPPVEVPTFRMGADARSGGGDAAIGTDATSSDAGAAEPKGIFASFSQRRRGKRSAADAATSEGSFISLNPTYEDDFMGKKSD
mmetsp:Transcript_119400/g.337811  ORF Transcript_119400/g.337811 Transcript_119400/m.337811 type:complete len:383 (-) Transcript_119400:63-1211(-)